MENNLGRSGPWLVRQMTLHRTRPLPGLHWGDLLVGALAILVERTRMGMEVFTNQRRAPKRKRKGEVPEEEPARVTDAAAPGAQRGPGFKCGFSDCTVPYHPHPRPSAGQRRVPSSYSEQNS